VIALLALAATIPMITGKIDLTVGYGIVLWHILAISLQTQLGLPWPAAVLIVLRARRCSACSTVSWSSSRRSTPSLPRWAPAP
jgi:ribose/xylose/arabinose/galactoside ABC-type transport system permease subunit